jgi:hypothetical protein
MLGGSKKGLLKSLNFLNPQLIDSLNKKRTVGLARLEKGGPVD